MSHTGLRRSGGALALLVAAALGLTACVDDASGADDPAATTSDPPSTTPEPADGTGDELPDEALDEPGEEPIDAVVIDITIRDGEVTPAGEQVEATVGEPIELRVDSDAPDEVHVHSSPEQEFAVAAKANQVFELTVEHPGQVEVETHETGVVIAELVVRP